MISLQKPKAEGNKIFFRSHNHSYPNIENIIKCSVMNILLNAELVSRDEVLVRGSYDFSLCYSTRNKSGDLRYALIQSHKSFEETVAVNFMQDVEGCQLVAFVRENPTCSSVIKGPVIESIVKMELSVEVYNDFGNEQEEEDVILEVNESLEKENAGSDNKLQVDDEQNKQDAYKITLEPEPLVTDLIQKRKKARSYLCNSCLFASGRSNVGRGRAKK